MERKPLDRLGVTGEDRLLLAKVLDRAEQARRRNIPVSTDFLSPAQQALAEDLLRLEGVTAYQKTGGYDGAERCVLLFLPDWMEDGEPPIRFLRASYRVEDGLSHRDLLGSLMALGVAREKLGDILAGEDSADVCVLEGIAAFLLQNWESAGRAKLRVASIPPEDLRVPEVQCETYRDTVSSLRLDAVASSGFRLSRGRAAELVTAGRVQVNWRECVKPDRLLVQGDTVTARGFGRIELAEVGSLTRKGRISIVVRRYR